MALAALEQVDGGAYANLALPPMLRRSNLTLSERAAATDLVYGSLRMRGALDFALAPLSRQALERLEPLVLRGLRLGAYELLFGGTAAHAAVAETVGAVARAGHRGQAGYVNAILRHLAATPPVWPDPDRDPAGWATTRSSRRAWIVEEALARLGPEELVALVEADNTRPEVSLRVTPGRTTRDELLAELAEAGVTARPSPLSPDCVSMERGDPARLAAVSEGRAVVQDAASALVAPAVGAAPGELVADLAAGPGGKAGHLAALGAPVLAVEGPAGPGPAGRRDGRPARGGRPDAHGGRRRPTTARCGPAAPTPSWSMRPAPTWATCAAAPRPASATAPTTSPAWSSSSSTCWRRPPRPSGPAGPCCTRSAPGPRPRPRRWSPSCCERRGDLRLEEARQLWPHRDGADGMFLARLRKVR